MKDEYDADYFLHGPATGKSLYEDYRWLPNLTIPMVQKIVEFLEIKEFDTVLDYGCARGYVVKAFRELGFDCRGVDASHWAIENCDPDVRHFVRCAAQVYENFDWIIAKDVLEHIPMDNIGIVIENLAGRSRKGFFVIVPLSDLDNTPYVVPDYEKDVTHKIRLSLASWSCLIRVHSGFDVVTRYRVEGIKDNYSRYPTGNGFVTARRIG